MTDKPVVGVDVAKDWLDLCWEGEAARIANNREAIGAWLDRVGPGLVACEPTGGYERPLVAALRERGIPFRRVHPNAVIAFRHSRGIKAKTDRITACPRAGRRPDPGARLIRDFVCEGLTRGVRPHIFGNQRLAALATRRRQLSAALHAENCRLALADLPVVRDSVVAVIAVLRAGLDAPTSCWRARDRGGDRRRPAIGRTVPAVADDRRHRPRRRRHADRRAAGTRPAVRQADRRAGRRGAKHQAQRQDPLPRAHRLRPAGGAARAVQCQPRRHSPCLAVPRFL